VLDPAGVLLQRLLEGQKLLERLAHQPDQLVELDARRFKLGSRVDPGVRLLENLPKIPARETPAQTALMSIVPRMSVIRPI